MNKKTINIFGVTGSIGQSTLQVLRKEKTKEYYIYNSHLLLERFLLIFRIIIWIILKTIYLKIRQKHGKVSIN